MKAAHVPFGNYFCCRECRGFYFRKVERLASHIRNELQKRGIKEPEFPAPMDRLIDTLFRTIDEYKK